MMNRFSFDINQDVVLCLGGSVYDRATTCVESGKGCSLETGYEVRLYLVLWHSFNSRFGVEVVWGIITR